MKRIMWTFGVGTPLKGKVVITNSEEFNDAMWFVYGRYGQNIVAFNYPEPYYKIEQMIKEYNYEILEEVVL